MLKCKNKDNIWETVAFRLSFLVSQLGAKSFSLNFANRFL